MGMVLIGFVFLIVKTNIILILLVFHHLLKCLRNTILKEFYNFNRWWKTKTIKIIFVLTIKNTNPMRNFPTISSKFIIILFVCLGTFVNSSLIQITTSIFNFLQYLTSCQFDVVFFPNSLNDS